MDRMPIKPNIFMTIPFPIESLDKLAIMPFQLAISIHSCPQRHVIEFNFCFHSMSLQIRNEKIKNEISI